MSRIALPAYLGSSATSLLGNSAFGVVLPWLVLERTGDPAATGLVAAITAIPGIPAAFFGGYLIDKIGRRRMAIFADFCSAAAVAALPIVDALFGLDLGWFILLGLLSAVFDVPGAAAREALLGNVSEASDVSLDRLGAMRGGIYGLCLLVGPAVAGGLLALLPSVTVVWLTAACSALAAIATVFMKVNDAVEPTDDVSPLAGLRYIRGVRERRQLLLVGFVIAALVAPLTSLLLPAHFNATGDGVCPINGLRMIVASSFSVEAIAVLRRSMVALLGNGLNLAQVPLQGLGVHANPHRLDAATTQ